MPAAVHEAARRTLCDEFMGPMPGRATLAAGSTGGLHSERSRAVDFAEALGRPSGVEALEDIRHEFTRPHHIIGRVGADLCGHALRNGRHVWTLRLRLARVPHLGVDACFLEAVTEGIALHTLVDVHSSPDQIAAVRLHERPGWCDAHASGEDDGAIAHPGSHERAARWSQQHLVALVQLVMHVVRHHTARHATARVRERVDPNGGRDSVVTRCHLEARNPHRCVLACVESKARSLAIRSRRRDVFKFTRVGADVFLAGQYKLALAAPTARPRLQFLIQLFLLCDQDVAQAIDGVAPTLRNLRCDCVAKDLADGKHEVVVHDGIMLWQHGQRTVPVLHCHHGIRDGRQVVDV
mmetsp:Transcript_912/g.2714  ORF Transcript_912/g.2714 Transcript_912/m.2714 type:complete len:352 (+) Transcript_912:41-1096(+)